MTCSGLKKVFLFLLCCIFCFLINASLSGAEQPVNNLSARIFSKEDLKKLEGFQGKEEEIVPVREPAADSKDAASFDVKVALSERFKAFLSLGDQTVKDLAGRDTGQSYNAVFGFQILLQ